MPAHRARFTHWRARRRATTQYLIDAVVERIVPEFETRGFGWYDDYAGGNPKEVAASTIPLQRREGPDWPTVQLGFDGRGKPTFNITFASMPPVCRRIGEPIAREDSSVVYAPACFALCKRAHGNFPCQFGYRWFSPMPYRRLDAEVRAVTDLLPELFDIFARGIPNEWLQRDFGFITEHVLLLGSWRLIEQRLQAKGLPQ